mmetsp:Transcript_42476/g.117190  ORF Transcript_42476/g.117190 Transcript_42476/m.117190 type:complete len:231 (-) Transcript_42476:406-1098(-)
MHTLCPSSADCTMPSTSSKTSACVAPASKTASNAKLCLSPLWMRFTLFGASARSASGPVSSGMPRTRHTTRRLPLRSWMALCSSRRCSSMALSLSSSDWTLEFNSSARARWLSSSTLATRSSRDSLSTVRSRSPMPLRCDAASFLNASASSSHARAVRRDATSRSCNSASYWASFCASLLHSESARCKLSDVSRFSRLLAMSSTRKLSISSRAMAWCSASVPQIGDDGEH